MKGLRIIPMFIVLMALSYVGILFVESNHDDVAIAFGSYYQSQPIPLGFVVLTSILIGMVICGALCSVELLSLYVQNRSLKRRLRTMETRTSITGNNQSAQSDRARKEKNEMLTSASNDVLSNS